MNTALYLRVSTTDQSTDSQRIELKEACRSRGWKVVAEYEDVISGSKHQRPGLDRLRADIKNGAIEVVAVVKIDRLARSLKDFLMLVQEFDAAGVALVATSQGIDTSKGNACGRLQMNVLSAVAEFERDLIRERTKAGLVAAKARGSKLGRPSAVLPVNWRDRVAVWSLTNGTLRELAAELGGVSLSTAHRLAKSA
jgi:putative DNA-invertase from lambdoid prophage Rac